MNQSPKPLKIGVSSRTSIHNVDNSKEEISMTFSEESNEQITDDDESENEGNASHSDSRNFNTPECLRNDNSQLFTSNLSELTELSHSQHNISNTSQPEPVLQHKGNLHSGIYIFCAILLAIFLGVPNIFSFHASHETLTISYLAQKFPSQSKETLENIETIIDDVLKVEPIHPAVFLFLYKIENNYHDNFIDSVAKFASNKLGVHEEHITVNERDYLNRNAEKDHGYLIHKYKPILNVKKVMVVKNLHKMPGKTAQVLHWFCDEISPLVDRAIYILTLKVDSLQGSEVNIAENNLNKVWNDLENDIRMPLITRVTSTVIKID